MTSDQPSVAAASDAPTPLRVAVLGTGYWATWCHGTVLADHPDVDFVGFWGRDAAKAEDAAARIGGTGTSDLEQLLERVDAVAVALPPDIQPELAVRAARAGKHLLLDKPLALSLDDADAVVEAVAERGSVNLTFLTYLFQDEVTSWVATMAERSREAGPWSGVEVVCAGSIDLPGSPYSDSMWRRQRGGLWDWGPHALSVVQALLPPITGVAGTRGPRDTVNLSLEHQGGAGSVLTLTVTAPEAAQVAEVRVWGPAGRYHLTLPAGHLREAYHRAVDDFVSAARSSTPHHLDVVYSRDVVAVLDAAQRHLAEPGRVTHPTHHPTLRRTTATKPVAVPAAAAGAQPTPQAMFGSTARAGSS